MNEYQISKETGKIVVHHIESWNCNPNLRLNINNGITISVKLHKLFHKIYGNGNNTRLQFEEFKQKHLEDK